MFGLCVLSGPQATHPLNDEVVGTFQWEHLALRSEDMDAHGTTGIGEQLLPLLNALEHKRHELSSRELPTPRVDPNHGFIFLSAQDDHVVI